MKHNPQSGNALFVILIAISLLAALSYAVSSSNRGVQNMSEERARLYATEIIEYSDIIANAVSQLRLRDCDADEISFENDVVGGYANGNAPSDETCHIFSLSGGGITWNAPNEAAMDANASPDNRWHFYGHNEIETVGTTTGAAASSDLLLVVDELDLTVCQQINKLSNVTTSVSTTPPTDTDITETLFTGTYGYTTTIGDEASTLETQPTACFLNTTDTKYTFYRVLIAR
ncbi:MAG: hypothetical protein ACRBCT_09960 [Alphaproteobacteria bacterium]